MVLKKINKCFWTVLENDLIWVYLQKLNLEICKPRKINKYGTIY